MKNKPNEVLMKVLFYSVPALLTVLIILLMISGLPEIWKLLWLPAVLFLGSFLMEKGKAFGSIFGILLGIGCGVDAIREVPRRVNMGNAGARIVPDFEDYWWQFWNTDIVWGFVFALFFLALGIFVFIKNRKQE